MVTYHMSQYVIISHPFPNIFKAVLPLTHELWDVYFEYFGEKNQLCFGATLVIGVSAVYYSGSDSDLTMA